MQRNKSTLQNLRLTSLLVFAAALACVVDDASAETATETGTTGETRGDGDPGDGDGDPGDGDGDPGDGDGDPGDGDGDPGDGDGDPGDGDGDPSICGDGNVDDGEACDDGNNTDTDECTNACTLAECGDNIVRDGVEECDDGNDDNTDACVEGCLNASCGDGYVGPGEGCDDQNADNTDDCLDTCEDASCGDGFVWANTEVCDDGNVDNTDDCLDTCEDASCGDGFVWANTEACDDGNGQDGDGCEDGCTVSAGAMKVAYGNMHTCALLWTGQLKCWGYGPLGRLGYANSATVGDNEAPASVPFVDLGGLAVDVAVGGTHTCAVLDDASVRCWGGNNYGQLGYGNVATIGDNEHPSSAGPVGVGDGVVSIGLGSVHTCVLTDQQTVRCWGRPTAGELGLGNEDQIGDDELPSSVAAIDLGDDAVELTVGGRHACALLANGGVRCWGAAGQGQLGQGNSSQIGDDEVPSSVPVLSLGNTPIVKVVAGQYHNCVLYNDQTIRCWGYSNHGQLGYGNSINIGDDESPFSVPTVNVGAPVDDLSLTGVNTCVRIGSNVKCWGNGSQGINGRGNTADIGDNEFPSSVGTINLGINVSVFHGGGTADHICATGGAAIRCWGHGNLGQLGYGNTNDIGDNEVPASAGDVPYY